MKIIKISIIICIIILSIVLVTLTIKNNFNQNIGISYFPNQEIIISRYNENLNWIDNEPFNRHPIIIYNKSDNYNFKITDNVKKIINLPNVGREMHTILYHIIKNYDNGLADISIFLVGSTDLSNKYNRSKKMVYKVEELNDSVFSCNLGDTDLNSIYNFKIDKYLSTNKDNAKINPDNSMKLSEIRPYGKWYEYNFKTKDLTKNICIAWNSIFSITREQILKRPKIFYENILKQIDSHHNHETVHYIERSWFLIFYDLMSYPHEEWKYNMPITI